MADTWLTVEQAAVKLRLSVRTINRHISSGKLQSRLKEGRREVLVSLPAEEGGREPEPADKAREREPEQAVTPAATDSVGACVPASEPLPPERSLEAEPQRTASATEQEGSDRQPPSDDADTDDNDEDPDADRMVVLRARENELAVAVTAYQTLVRAVEVQAARSQRSARFAWGVVSVMVVGVVIAVGWTTSRLATHEIQIGNVEHQLSQATRAADKAAQERDEILSRAAKERDELQGKWEAEAKRASHAEGRLEERMAGAQEAAVPPPPTFPTTNSSLVGNLTSIFPSQPADERR